MLFLALLGTAPKSIDLRRCFVVRNPRRRDQRQSTCYDLTVISDGGHLRLQLPCRPLHRPQDHPAQLRPPRQLPLSPRDRPAEQRRPLVAGQVVVDVLPGLEVRPQRGGGYSRPFLEVAFSVRASKVIELLRS